MDGMVTRHLPWPYIPEHSRRDRRRRRHHPCFPLPVLYLYYYYSTEIVTSIAIGMYKGRENFLDFLKEGQQYGWGGIYG